MRRSVLFPASVVEMIAIAEETGRLDKELVRLATSYESELDRRLRMLVALAEPALLFLMAGLIGTIVIGMLLPIFRIQEAAASSESPPRAGLQFFRRLLMSRRTHEPRRGFTLIELLLVMVILVVLAGIAVPIYINRAGKARSMPPPPTLP